jgi:hypothetical protein
MAMQAEIKAKWIEALESGKYRQRRGAWGGKSVGAYCCLQLLRQEVLGKRESGSEYGAEVKGAGLSSDEIQRCTHMNDRELRTFPRNRGMGA